MFIRINVYDNPSMWKEDEYELLVNTDQILWFRPLSPDYWQIAFAGGYGATNSREVKYCKPEEGARVEAILTARQQSTLRSSSKL